MRRYSMMKYVKNTENGSKVNPRVSSDLDPGTFTVAVREPRLVGASPGKEEAGLNGRGGARRYRDRGGHGARAVRVPFCNHPRA